LPMNTPDSKHTWDVELLATFFPYKFEDERTY
jgi:hypothetical protein